MKKNRMEKLCRPVLLLVCETRRRAAAGMPPSREEFERELTARLDAVHNECSLDAALARDFARIEKPLVFFLDYMVKEGNYDFSADWQLLARKYKELSGDEKFFELLSDTVDDPESDDRLEEFFFMLALGFDGVHRNDPGFIERRMRVCAARFAHDFNPVSEPVTPLDCTLPAPRRRRKFFRSAAFVLILGIVFALGALVFNYVRLRGITEEYRKALEAADYAGVLRYSAVAAETGDADGEGGAK